MMRILFIAPYGGLGGSENVLVNVLERLDRTRFEPHVLLLEQGPLRRSGRANWASRRSSSTCPARPGVAQVPDRRAPRSPARSTSSTPTAARPRCTASRSRRRLQRAAGLDEARPLLRGPPDARARRPLRPRRLRLARDGAGVRRPPEDRVSVVYPGVILRDLKPVEAHRARRSCPSGGWTRSRASTSCCKAAAQLRARGRGARRPPRRPAGQRPHRDAARAPARSPTSSGSAASKVGWADDLDEVIRDAPASSRSRASPRARTAPRARARRSC